MSADPFDTDTSADARQRLWGFAVLIAIAVIVLPLLLDGSGSESNFRRVEKLREEPPRIIDKLGNTTINEIPGQSGIDDVSLADQNIELVDEEQNPDSVAQTNDTPEEQLNASDFVRDAVGSGDDSLQLGAATAEGNGSGVSAVNNGADATLSDTEIAEQIMRESAEPVSGDPPRNGQTVDSQNAQNNEDLLRLQNLDSNGAANDFTPDSLTAWVVLAGAFNQEPDALETRDRLREDGFASFVRDRENPNDTFQVLVGPMIKEQGALEVLERVAILLGGSPVVMSYP